METGFDWITRYGYVALFVLLMLGIVGLPVPDETLLVFVGYLSFKGTLRLEPALATAFLGSACGISLSYALGRFVGLHALSKFAPLFHIRTENLALTYRWVGRWGKYVLLVAYFIPGVRHVAALVVGASLLPPPVFARFAYTGALIWCGTFIGLGYVAGEEWRQFSPILHRTLGIAAVLALLGLGIALLIMRRRVKLNEGSRTPPV
jgi:membrane protein DedA with SNARE-associated domain